MKISRADKFVGRDKNAECEVNGGNLSYQFSSSSDSLPNLIIFWVNERATRAEYMKMEPT